MPPLRETRPAHDFFERIGYVLKLESSQESRLCLYELLQDVCAELTEGRYYSNLFSQLSDVCHRCAVPQGLSRDIQNLRYRLHGGEGLADLSYGCLVMAEFVSAVLKEDVPQELLSRLPVRKRMGREKRVRGRFWKCLRVMARRVDERFIYAETEKAEDGRTEIKVDCLCGGSGADLHYLNDLSLEGVPLNLLNVSLDGEGNYLPQCIIVFPDYLLDASTLSHAFKEYSHSPLHFILDRLSPNVDSPYKVLGNLVGQFMDDLMHQDKNCPVTYAKSLGNAFRSSPLAFSLQDLDARFRFHEQARLQFNNIKRLVEEELEEKYGFQLDKVLVEPSFVCESLGVSGRLDFLQSDFSRMVEQKSGRMAYNETAHVEAHYVQMMLYLAMLEFNVGVQPHEAAGYLYYSRYPNGMLSETMYNQLLFQVLELRNKIVAQELRCVRHGVRSVLEHIKLEDLCGKNGRPMPNYERNRLANLLSQLHPLQHGDNTERMPVLLDYFYYFYDFLCREQLLSKVGNIQGMGSHSFSDLWNVPAAVRAENGDMYSELSLISFEEKESETGKGRKILALCREDRQPLPLTNFRVGDVVQVYTYDKAETPDIRRTFVLRGKLALMQPDEIRVELSNGQRSAHVFQKENQFFAVEHDHVEASYNELYRGLFAFLSAPSQRQELLLGVRKPQFAEQVSLCGNYGTFQEMVEKQRRAQDYFLVIGPPGSGKTNCALRCMVEEELRSGTEKILLLAYTNRAVDEICGMLEQICETHPRLLNDYLRIGAELTTAQAYRRRLLSARMAQVHRAADVRRLLESMPVIVGTATTLSSLNLLQHTISFDVAFIDEASQMLEPHLLKLLGGARNGQPFIRRFVMIGDQKQLPAVVRQDERSSVVHSPRLRSLCLHDGRRSLFERLLMLQMRADNHAACHLLKRQGRMHPDLFSFVNRYFYQGQLQCVPLDHQTQTLQDLYPRSCGQPAANPFVGLLLRHRCCFLDTEMPPTLSHSRKDNAVEALLASQVIVAYASLLQAEGRALHDHSVGVVVPYRNQISRVQSCLQSLGFHRLDLITIDTVERFQGSQRDLIVYSFTVSHPSQLRFLASASYQEEQPDGSCLWVDRKLNVALTRARHQLVLIGSSALLGRNAIFREMLDAVPRISMKGTREC
ncbi:MAG: ATP-dependent helicase [Bacteroidaceae bacterium]|nr:ATP-dependent helicase [Bacteroidaceae bacterium]